MKKMFALILALALCAAPAFAEAAPQPSPEVAFAPTDSTILVACFSATGNTWPLAEYAAEFLNADLFRIEPEIPYTEADLNYGDSASRANQEMNDETSRPALKATVENIEQYDTILLGFPIWWGQAPRLIETFVEAHDLSGKTILPFCTSGSSGYGQTGEILAALTDETVTWLEGRRFRLAPQRKRSPPGCKKWQSSLMRQVKKNRRYALWPSDKPLAAPAWASSRPNSRN